MQGFIAGPVRLRIGEKWYEKHVYVAPIQLDMLLGFDILYQHSAILDMGHGTLEFDGQKLDLKIGGRNSSPVVARVTVVKRKVTTPNSVVQLPCKMDATLSEDYVVEAVDGLKVLVPKSCESWWYRTNCMCGECV